jgi:hypothetical protein
MTYQRLLLVWLLLAALVASSVELVEAKKDKDKKADLGAADCVAAKHGKKCKLERTKGKDIFAAGEISIQLEDGGEIHEFVGSSRNYYKAGKKSQRQWYGEFNDFTLNLIESEEGLLFGSTSDDDTIYSITVDLDGNLIVEGKATADFPDELDADLTFETFPGKHTDGEGSASETNNNDNGIVHESNSMRKLGLRGGVSSSSLLHSTQRQLAVDTTMREFDIMVVWTKNAECHKSGQSTGCTTTAGTETTMRGLIDLAVAETNVAFSKSGVYVTVRLVHAYRDPTYTEDSSNAFSKALYDITYTGSQYAAMDDVHATRAAYGADLVAMIIHEPTSCGLAWLGPRKDLMFSVSHWSCATGYFSFGHEIGHNLVSKRPSLTQLLYCSVVFVQRVIC